MNSNQIQKVEEYFEKERTRRAKIGLILVFLLLTVGFFVGRFFQS